MDGVKEAHYEARIQELETQLKMAQEETDELMKAFAEEKQYSIEIGDYIDEMKKKAYETFQDTPAGDRIFGEAVQNPEEQCHSLDEYLAKAKRYMIQDGEKAEELQEELEEVWDELEKTKEEDKELKEKIEELEAENKKLKQFKSDVIEALQFDDDLDDEDYISSIKDMEEQYDANKDESDDEE